MRMKYFFIEECFVAVATLTHCYVESIAVAWRDFQHIYRIVFLLFILYKLHSHKGESLPQHLFLWFLWQAHGWFPISESLFKHTFMYTLLSLSMFAMVCTEQKLRFVVIVLLLICYINQEESRPSYYGTIVNIIRTFLFWIDHLFTLTHKKVEESVSIPDKDSLSVKPTHYMGSGIWILWTHPMLLPLSFFSSLKKIRNLWRSVHKNLE
jgi:hypothetical protein